MNRTDGPARPWRAFSSRFSLLIELSSLQMLTVALFGCFLVWRSQGSRLDIGIAVCVPALAGVFMVIIGSAMPSLVAAGLVPRPGIRFPLNLTMPMVFSSLLLVSQMVWSTGLRSSSALVNLNDDFRAVEMYGNAAVLLIVTLSQVAILSAFAFIDRLRSRVN